MKNMVRVLYLTVCLLTGGSPVAGDQVRCANQLVPKVRMESYEGDFILANGVAITGDFYYPLEVVLKNLDLLNVDLGERYKGQSVVSIAEGMSGFLPHMLKSGVNIKGIDLWYHTNDFPDNYSGRLMRDFMSLYGESLVQGDARRIPLPDGSVDALFSHMLVNNVSLAKQKSILRDVIRVLNGGGQAKLYGFGDPELKFVREFLAKNYGGIVSFEIKEIYFFFKYYGETREGNLSLLTINKLRPQ